MGSNYTPFERRFSELQTNDLLALKKVHEGWYVDYKAGPLSTRSYAKAISAMANTFGGWIFIGVREESRNQNVAGAFPGIDPEQIDTISQNIRQSVMEHLNPQPFFELRTIDAPDSEANKKVVCLYVPSSPKAPIIHSDGRIYRRINDASEPVAENNRDAIEHLLKRVDQFELFYKDWFNCDPELSPTEDKVTYLRLISVCDYWAQEGLCLEESTEDFVSLLTAQTNDLSFSVEYDTVYSQQGGFICRSVNPHDAGQIATTLFFWRNLHSEFWLPLPSFSVDDYSNYNYQCDELYELVSYLRENGYRNSIVLDLTQAFGAIDGFFALNRKFQQHLGYTGDTHVKFKLGNAWRRIPALALKLDELGWNKYGVPMILHDTVSSPAGGNLETFQTVNFHKESDNNGKEFLVSMLFFAKFLFSIGLGVGAYDSFTKLIEKSVMIASIHAKKRN